MFNVATFTKHTPILMDSTVQISDELLTDVFEWDILNWSQALNVWTPVVHQLGGGKGLEIGARQGGPSLWLALHGFQMICSDVKDPQPTAQPLHQKYDVSERIQYKVINALEIPYENDFDVIIFKSVLGAIGGYGRTARIYAAVRQMYRALRPGGWLLFAENLAGSPLHRWGRKKLSPWGTTWNYISYAELPQLLAPFKEIRYETVGVIAGLGRTERQRRILGKLDRFFDRIIPPSWRYIVIGAARK